MAILLQSVCCQIIEFHDIGTSDLGFASVVPSVPVALKAYHELQWSNNDETGKTFDYG